MKGMLAAANFSVDTTIGDAGDGGTVAAVTAGTGARAAACEAGAGDAAAVADLGEALQPGCDVDAIAQQVAVPFDHVADGDTDAKRHLAAGWIGHVAGAQALLDIDRTAHRFNRAREFGEHGVARGIENAAAA